MCSCVQVRIWNTVRQQDDIIKWMRRSSGLENHKNLVAYWKFDDASEFDPEGRALPHLSARDSSGQGNDLPLVVMPQPRAAVIEKVLSEQGKWEICAMGSCSLCFTEDDNGHPSHIIDLRS